ncbi:hypothetical protein VNO77_31456 [Canavalia gladiata]|uniref:Uncharacterized protein n=1 Tax=Canavalia gladiata TaxID=3824 RepID=A0AAN9KNW9_CANGL
MEPDLVGGSPILGHLVAGILISLYSLSIIHHIQGTKAVAEFGIVFLISLELFVERFNLMKKYVFGLGSAHALATAVTFELVERDEIGFQVIAEALRLVAAKATVIITALIAGISSLRKVMLQLQSIVVPQIVHSLSCFGLPFNATTENRCMAIKPTGIVVNREKQRQNGMKVVIEVVSIESAGPAMSQHKITPQEKYTLCRNENLLLVETIKPKVEAQFDGYLIAHDYLVPDSIPTRCHFILNSLACQSVFFRQQWAVRKPGQLFSVYDPQFRLNSLDDHDQTNCFSIWATLATLSNGPRLGHAYSCLLIGPF